MLTSLRTVHFQPTILHVLWKLIGILCVKPSQSVEMTQQQMTCMINLWQRKKCLAEPGIIRKSWMFSKKKKGQSAFVTFVGEKHGYLGNAVAVTATVVIKPQIIASLGVYITQNCQWQETTPMKSLISDNLKMENWNNFVDELKEYFNSISEDEKEMEWQRMSEWNRIGPSVEEWLKSVNHLRNTEDK